MIRASLQVAAMVLVGFVSSAVAQYGPAGNTHPEAPAVSEATGENAAVAFGRRTASTADVPSKIAFAEAIDLSPLRSLAVQQPEGRVKILDTLAKETVQNVTGRKKLTLPVDPADPTKGLAAFDPMFTLLDLTIDPVFYLDRPLVQVGYLPLRRELLAFAFPDDEDEAERWKKLTRVSPAIMDRHMDEVFRRHEGEDPYRRGIQKAERARNLALGTINNWLVVAPESVDRSWRHIVELPPSHPLRRAAVKMGDAWRAEDAARTNAAILAFAEAAQGVNPALYPTTQRSIEFTYNKLNAFEWGSWLYLGSFVSLVLAFGTGRRWLVRTGMVFLVAAVLMHSAGFVARCIIAERFAIQNQFESMTGISLFAAVVGLGIMAARRQWLFGAAAAGTGFIILLAATQTAIPGEHIDREAAILNTSVLLKYHVTTVLVSYGLITLGLICSLFYLGTYYFGRRQGAALATVGASALRDEPIDPDADDAPKVGIARTLADLDTAQLTVLQLAFWTLGVGILLGAWWADHSWGRWWAFDPKETWALLTWIVYLIVIHVRLTMGGEKRGVTTAWLSVAGFIVMLWTYFGVNLLLPGLHAYA